MELTLSIVLSVSGAVITKSMIEEARLPDGCYSRTFRSYSSGSGLLARVFILETLSSKGSSIGENKSWSFDIHCGNCEVGSDVNFELLEQSL